MLIFVSIFVQKEVKYTYLLNKCTACGQHPVGSDDFWLALQIHSMYIKFCTFFKSINEVETIYKISGSKNYVAWTMFPLFTKERKNEIKSC